VQGFAAKQGTSAHVKITEIELITFTVTRSGRRTKWGYGEPGPERQVPHSITRIATDDGAEGFSEQGWPGYFYTPRQDEIDGLVKPLLIGEDPLDRERLWQLMSRNLGFSEGLIGNIDCALWDLAGRATGLSVSRLLGRARDRIKAYASTAPNIGGPEDYARHAVECKQAGYRAYKVHGYIYWDPHRNEPAPGRPAYPKEDIEICRAVRDAVGDDMALMLDPWGIYTLEEAIWAGQRLEELDFYFLEHPMHERTIEPYRKLCSELRIPVCGPELAPGGVFSRAEWALRHATDIGRTDINFGGITGVRKTVDMYESLGMKCEIHVGGFGNAQILAATTEDTCEYFERGLLGLGMVHTSTPPYLKAPCDSMDADGYVRLPEGPGLGFELDWDYIDSHRVRN
jgi:L-alanine-DL-glutamate epimerase-like enolase superfamily enzyme